MRTLKSHLVQSGHEVGLIPPAGTLLWCGRQQSHRIGELGGSEGDVRLWVRAQNARLLRAPRHMRVEPLLLLRAPQGEGHPRAGRRGGATIATAAMGTRTATMAAAPPVFAAALDIAAAAATTTSTVLVATLAAAAAGATSALARAVCAARHPTRREAGMECCLSGDLALVSETQFFEDQLLAGGDEFRKQIRVDNVDGNAREARIEAVQQVEDELQVEDCVADITERIGGGFHILVVLVDGEVALGHGVELVAKEDGTRSIVRLEEGLDGRPKLSAIWFSTMSRLRTSSATEPSSQLWTQESVIT